MKQKSFQFVDDGEEIQLRIFEDDGGLRHYTLRPEQLMTTMLQVSSIIKRFRLIDPRKEGGQ